MEEERVQKILSEMGVCSRRKGEQLIQDGRVTVNGKIVGLGDKATRADRIAIDGEAVGHQEAEEKKVYLMMNKPNGVVSTVFDPEGRQTVVDLVPRSYGRVFPVGRLDHNSTGLILLTNDGEFANLITHPSSAPEKEYIVRGKYPLNGDEVERLAKGLYITREGYTALPAKAEILEDNDDDCLLSITIREGKKREVRHMMETLGHPVASLVRVRIGELLLGRLMPGAVKEIDPSAVQRMIEEGKRTRQASIRSGLVKVAGEDQD
jgi:23S rRNA pseudouridine2605 synthase